jgi:CSLREA domain-containing protein
MWSRCVIALSLIALALALGAPMAAGVQFTVNSTADGGDLNTADGVCAATGGACTLRAAIQQANAAAGADVVVVPPGTYAVSSPLSVTSLMTITGTGGARATLIAGAPSASVVTIASSGVTVRGVTVTGGRRGIDVQTGSDILLDQVVVRDNGLTSPANLSGGGIYVAANGAVTLSRSLVAENTLISTSGTALGAGIYVASGGVLTAVATTIVRNVANSQSGSGAYGGGVNVGLGGQAVLRHVTMAGNSSPSGSAASYGGNLYSSGQTVVADSVVASGQATFGANCSGSITAQGRNIDSGTTCAFGAGHLNSTDPQLLPLADHGGPTDSRALSTTSPARDAALACPAGGLDQRGAAAPSGSACDIGAVELSAELGLAVQAAQSEAAPGADVTYIVRVTNGGPDPAPGTVLDLGTGGATPTLASPSAGTCTLQVRCELGTLARGQEVTVTVVARAGATPIAFTANVASGLPDPVAANNTAQITTPVTTTAPPSTTPPPPPPPAVAPAAVAASGCAPAPAAPSCAGSASCVSGRPREP